MRTFSMLVAAWCVACSSDPKAAPPAPDQPEGAADRMPEIAKEPRTATAATTGFLEFTIELPASASPAATNNRTSRWTFKGSKLAVEVEEVGALPSDSTLASERGVVLSVDEGTKTVTEEPGAYLVIERRRATDTKYTVPAASRVEYCRDLDPAEPPSGICCRAVGDDTVDLRAFGEQVCRSIQVKNRKTSTGG